MQHNNNNNTSSSYTLILSISYMIITTMASSALLFFLAAATIMHISLSAAEEVPAYNNHSCINTMPNYTADSAFPSNLNLTFSSLIGNATLGNKFYNSSTGQSPDRVYALFLCRPDGTPECCRRCIEAASEDIISRCMYRKEAIIWYDVCMLRYANRSIFAAMEDEPTVYWLNEINVSEVSFDQFDSNLKILMNDLVNKAVSGSSSDMFGAGNATAFPAGPEFYGLVQCTPDISQSDCSKCLSGSVGYMSECCEGKLAARILMPSCNIRYDWYAFYNESAVTSLSPATSTNSGVKGRKSLWITVGTSVSAILVVLLGFYMWRRKRADKEENRDGQKGTLAADHYSNENLQAEKQVESQEFPLFQLDLINAATKHFSNENKLGEGGFGPVYKGTLVDGKEIAVKRLSRTSGQGIREFKNEVTLIARLQHRNLVRLLGYCLEGDELLLIYEYMPNKSLDVFLFDSTRAAQLDWKRRLGIINGIARGLLYLHEDSRLRVIHRDLKAGNVLLDHEMNPKISDFGMARIFGGNQSEANTNRVVGTYGYMAPEYAMEGLFSIKSDVFSFGVLLLEIISGKKNNGFYLSELGQSLLSFAWKLWSKGQGLELLDPLIVQSCVADEALKCIHIGLLCVQEDAADRPTMSSVVVMLASDTVTLPQPTQPAFSVGRVVTSAEATPDHEVCSVNEVTLSSVSAR